MKILILGGTGFVGKNLLNRLRMMPCYMMHRKDGGHDVVSVSRSAGVDILDYQQIADSVKETQPDIIFNLASHGGSLHYVKKYAADVYTDNLQMALNLYRAAKEHAPACKIIQPFSNCSYPGSSSVQNEENWLKGSVHPSIFSFGNSKRSIYYLSGCYYEQHGIRTVNLLFPNTYGPGDSCDPNKTHALNGMIIRMLKAKSAGDKQFVVWGTGAPVREWAYIDDFIEGLVLAMDIDHMEYPINIGQEKGYSISESAMLIKKACGFAGEIVFDDSYPDGDSVKILGKSKFEKHFPNFKFYNHQKGIENTVKYYEENL